MVCFDLVYSGKNVHFHIIFSIQYSISITKVEVDPNLSLLHNGIAEPQTEF